MFVNYQEKEEEDYMEIDMPKQIPVTRPKEEYQFPTPEQCGTLIVLGGKRSLFGKGATPKTDRALYFEDGTGVVNTVMTTNPDGLGKDAAILVDVQNIHNTSGFPNTNMIPVFLKQSRTWTTHYTNEFSVVADVAQNIRASFTEGDDMSLIIVWILIQISANFRNYLTTFFPKFAGNAFILSNDFYRCLDEHFAYNFEFLIHFGPGNSIYRNHRGDYLTVPVRFHNGTLSLSFGFNNYTLSREDFKNYLFESNTNARVTV